MAIFLKFHLLLPSFFFLACLAQSYHQFPSHALMSLPVTKDAATLQYLTNLRVGNRLLPVNLVVDLGGSLLWLDCASGFGKSIGRLIPSCSIHCSLATAVDGEIQVPCNGSHFTGDDNNKKTCDIMTRNSITQLATKGKLVEDIVAVRSVDWLKRELFITVDPFLFSCGSPGTSLQGLSSGAKGMLGLGRSSMALPSQLAKTTGFHRKFTLCLSSSSGVVLSGHNPSDLIFGPEISKSLMYTPLLTNSQEYFIKVKSIKINGKRLSITTEEAKLSTTVAYTTMESSIYETFTKAYMKAASAMSLNMTRVATVAPFGLCFSSKGVASSQNLGPIVPAVDLVLQSEMVKWRFHGDNLMVPVSDEVMCLGFLDGGPNPTSNIVIGGLQLEDFVLEFDLGTSMLGFNSLLRKQTSCSKVLSSSTLNESM